MPAASGGSGRKVKYCCNRFYEATPIPTDSTLGMFVSHTLLWPTETATLEQLRKRAAALPGRWLVRVLSALQWILRDEIGRHEWSKGYAFLEEFGDPVTARKAYAWLVTGRAWTIFDRSTIPALMQVRLVCGPDADRSVDSADMRELTQLLLITNDLLSVDRGSARRTTTGVDTTLLALHTAAASTVTDPHWGAATARNWALLTAGLELGAKHNTAMSGMTHARNIRYVMD